MSWDDAFRLSLAVLSSLSGGAVIVFAMSSWLGKVWAERILSKERHELELLRNEHDVRFSKLHLERAEAIKALHLKLQELDDSLHSVLKNFQAVGEPDIEKKVERSVKAHQEFIEIYKQNRIFFTKPIDELMKKITISSRDTHVDVSSYRSISKERSLELIPQLWKERDESWQSARKTFYEDMQKMMEELEKAFREMLGVK